MVLSMRASKSKNKLIPVTQGEAFDLPDISGFPQRHFPLVAESGDVVGLFIVTRDAVSMWVDVRPLWSIEHHRVPLPANPTNIQFQMALNVALRPFGYIYYEIPQEGQNESRDAV